MDRARVARPGHERPMTFDRELWRRARPLFDELVKLDGDRRRARLDALSAEDPALASAVERLLRADSSADAALSEYQFGPPAEPSPARTESPDPLGIVGRTTSHFEVTDYLASGGMGAVYEAVDLQLGRAVALKFLLPHQQMDESAKRRLLQEARSTAALDHPNLCSVYEVGESALGVFLAMPLYAGETLKDRLAREHALPIDEALRITTAVATGIASAHARGIVHRDLKPGNIMLLPDGSLKVLDFGIAKVRDITLTKPEVTLGTIAYMAPDQIRGERADARADLWALGVMLYEMLCGALPFRAESEVAVIHAVLHDEPPLPSSLRSGIPPELDDIVYRLLRKNPSRRYQSATALLAALHELDARDAGGLRRALGTQRRRLQRRVRSRAGVFAAAALLVVSAAAAAAWSRSGVAKDPVRLAVLPLVPIGDTASSYLAVGLTDAIARDLGQLGGIITPSYQAVSGYRRGAKTVGQVASEQQATALLRGTIRQVGDRVRVEAQLLDVRRGTELWNRRFERPVREVIGVERDVGDAVVEALRIRTSSAERRTLESAPTTDASAYDRYLRARATELAEYPMGQSMPDDSVRKIVSLYSQARWLDPRFALARARLALAHAQAAARFDTTNERRENARLEAEAALRLRSSLPEGHEALAAYWTVRGVTGANWRACRPGGWCGSGSSEDQRQAMRELRLALENHPHDAELHLALGAVLETVDQGDEATAEYEQATRLDPGNPNTALLVGLNYSFRRRHEEAVRAFSHAIALAPERHDVKLLKGLKYLRWKGSADTLAAIMRTVPLEWDPDGMATYARFSALWVQRRYAEGLEMLARSGSAFSGDGLLCEPTSLMRARLHEALGHRAQARRDYDAARVFLEDSVRAHPSDPSFRVSLGVAFAGLGRANDAVREAERAIELAPIGGVGATGIRAAAVQVFAKTGRSDRAFALLELLFTMPAGRDVTVPFVRAWPAFDPLRRDSMYEPMLARFDPQQ